MSKYIQYLLEGHIAHVVLQRPEKANAFDLATWHALREALHQADQSPDVRVVLIRAEGKHFSAGIDLGLLLQIKQEVNQIDCPARAREYLLHFIRDLQGCIQAIEDCRKPVIALVQGACIGGGLDLITACDLRLCSQQASFCVKEVDLGIVADLGTLQRLSRLVGEGIAREWVFTARSIDWQEALQRGLVNQVLTDKDALYETGLQLAHTIASKSPLAIRGSKQVMNYSREHSTAEGLEYVALWNAAHLLSKDIETAIMASLQQQSARFDN